MVSLYRKYRSKTFDELIGQDHVRRYFANALDRKEISHAYIFTGPRGTGKTSTARLLAKVLNCCDPEGYNPCNNCGNCKAIDEGSFMDVIELDAASNRGIDEIREIRDSTNYRPVHGKYKVYIIDEFHMLTKEAFNALLKTLEEPPEHVVFILATTNLEKVPQTIISRAQLISFKNIREKDIVMLLRKVSAQEGVTIDEKSLNVISKRAKGGARDALSLFEQVMKFCSKEVTSSETLSILGLFDDDMVEDFINFLISGDVDNLLKLSSDLFESGKEPEALIEQSIEKLFIKIKNDKNYALVKLVRELNEVSKELKYSENKKAVFEIYVTSLAYGYKKLDIQYETNLINQSINTLEEGFFTENSEQACGGDYQLMLQKLANDSSKMNLGLFFALKDNSYEISEGKLTIFFPSESSMEYQITRKYLSELKINVLGTFKGVSEVKPVFGGDVKKDFPSNQDISSKLFS